MGLDSSSAFKEVIMAAVSLVEKMKVILGIEKTDNAQNPKLEAAADYASNVVRMYCNFSDTEPFPWPLIPVITDLAMAKFGEFKNAASVGDSEIQSMSDNGQSISYRRNEGIRTLASEQILNNYLNILNRYRRMK